MALKVGINGFGRIGRAVVRSISKRGLGVQVVGINDLASPEELAHLLRYDSVHGRFETQVEVLDGNLAVGGEEIHCSQIRNVNELPWRELGVDIVLECTGLFRDKSASMGHVEAGARKVIISAPGKNVDATFVLGVNEEDYDPKNHTVVSNASCTTNGIAPPVKVLHDNFGISKGLMTTIHSYTNDQVVLDTFHTDMRRARGAALNMIPTTTGAAKAVTQVIPSLQGRIHGLAFRVPTPSVSVIDFVGDLEKEATVEEVNAAQKKAAAGQLKGILEYCEEELVSMDFKGNPHSSIVDAPGTMVIGGNMVKILAWYDNEFGYSSRMVDLGVFMANN